MQMMHKGGNMYSLFSGEGYYAEGGYGDYVGTYNTREEAIAADLHDYTIEPYYSNGKPRGLVGSWAQIVLNHEIIATRNGDSPWEDV